MHPVERVSAHDLRVIGDCLNAAVNGPFFDDDEYHTLMGFEREEIGEFLATWPRTDDPEGQDTAVNNVLNMLLGYPHHRWSDWSEYSSATPADIATVLSRWRGDDGFDASARGVFDRLR